MLSRRLESREATLAFGSALGRLLRPGDVALLSGPLGAGKTTLVQGIAHGMGVDAPVTSPTFTLIHEYEGGDLRLIHVDLYRLEQYEDAVGAGFEDYLGSGGVVVVEWPERLGARAPEPSIRIDLSISGDNVRQARLAGRNPRSIELIAALDADP